MYAHTHYAHAHTHNHVHTRAHTHTHTRAHTHTYTQLNYAAITPNTGVSIRPKMEQDKVQYSAVISTTAGAPQPSATTPPHPAGKCSCIQV